MQVKRLFPVLIGAIALLSACSDSPSSSSTTAVNLDGTTFATLPPTASTSPTATTLPGEGEVSTTEQEYTILTSDTSRLKVANHFGITVAELDAANVATPGYGAFYPGLKIKIPAGAKVPGSDTTATTAATVPGATTAPTTGATTATTNASGECTPGSYTILADDTSRVKVADKFNITVEQLDAANASTKGYSAFYPGLKIVIPCA